MGSYLVRTTTTKLIFITMFFSATVIQGQLSWLGILTAVAGFITTHRVEHELTKYGDA